MARQRTARHLVHRGMSWHTAKVRSACRGLPCITWHAADTLVNSRAYTMYASCTHGVCMCTHHVDTALPASSCLAFTQAASSCGQAAPHCLPDRSVPVPRIVAAAALACLRCPGHCIIDRSPLSRCAARSISYESAGRCSRPSSCAPVTNRTLPRVQIPDLCIRACSDPDAYAAPFIC